MRAALLCTAGAVAIGAAYLLGRWQVERFPSWAHLAPAYVGFEPARLDLGEQLWGDLVPVELTFVNHGREPLVVQAITSTCDCLLTDEQSLTGRRIEAGGALTIGLTLATGAYPGLKHRTLTLTDGAGNRYTAELVFDVRGTWNVEPDVVDFGEVVVGDRTRAEVERIVRFVSQADALVGEPGFLNTTIVQKVCFRRWECVPASGQEYCSAE